MFSTSFTQPQQFFGAWQTLMTGQTERLEELANQMAETEAAAMKRASDAIDEYAKLMKASLRYNQQLAAAWRSQFIEASQQVAKSTVGDV